MKRALDRLSSGEWTASGVLSRLDSSSVVSKSWDKCSTGARSERIILEAHTMTANIQNTQLTRRMILGGAAGLAAQAIVPRTIFGANETKPNSVFSGVRVGCITYSYRGGADTAEYTLECLLKDGLSETELMDGPIRSYAGLPARAGRGGKKG